MYPLTDCKTTELIQVLSHLTNKIEVGKPRDAIQYYKNNR